MLSEFSRKKYISCFNLLDADKSGTIEFEDFAAHARYIKDDQGWSDQDPKWLQLLDTKKRGWQKIQEAVDTNNGLPLEACRRYSRTFTEYGRALFSRRTFFVTFYTVTIK